MDDNTAHVLKEGVIGGLAAYASAVLVLALLHAVQGESIFHSAAAMGSVLFYSRDPAGGARRAPDPLDRELPRLDG